MDSSRLPSFNDLIPNQEEGTATRFRLAFGQARTLSLPAQIATQIGDRILDGRISAASWIREQELASEFEVSRSPIREAMQLLEREGLVLIHPRRGAQVTGLSVEHLVNLTEIRVALLGVVARRTAELRDPIVLRTLDSGLEALARYVDGEGGGDTYAEILSRLTLYCSAAIDNPPLLAMIVSLSLQMARYTRLGLSEPARRRRSYQLWVESVDAFRRGDSLTAQRLWELRLVENSAAIAERLKAAA